MPGRDLSAELFNDAPQSSGGKDLSANLFEATPQQRAPASTSQRVQAVGAGIGRGMFADLVGLPVDTMANVLDLGKMGIGYVTSKVTHQVPPEWTQPMDRSKVVGSSNWIAQKIGDGAQAIGIPNPIAPARPDDAVSRVLYTGGRGVGASVVPNPRAALSAGVQLTNASMGGLSGLVGGAVGEVAPEWAGVASLLPSAGIAAGATGIQRAVRGGEAGRQAMEQRMLDLQNGGVQNPSVGLASGNSTIMGLENLLSQTPFSSGQYSRSGAANIAGMKAKTEALRDSISSEFGPVAAGSAIQADLKGAFRNRVKDTSGKLSNRVADLIGGDTTVPIDSTLAKATQLSTPMKGAEATTGDLISPRIAQIADNLKTDVYGGIPKSTGPLSGNPTLNLPVTDPGLNTSLWNSQPATVPNSSLWNVPTVPHNPLPQRSQSIGKQDIPNASLWNSQKDQGIPFTALKSLRTSIGDEASSPSILGTPEGAQFKQLYGAMSQDMRQAAAGSDRAGAGIDIGPLLPSQMPASMALNRANTFYSRAATRAEDLNGLANRDTPEGAYGAITNSLNNGPSLYGKLRGAVDPATRQKVAATVVDQLGTAKPGQQSAAGDEWSASTFLTNYSKLYQNGGGEALFKRLPGGQKQADQLADIAKTAEMVGKASKVWANPSGTAPALSARGTAVTLTAGWFLHPIVAGATSAGLAGANQLSQRLLLNPKFVNWLAKAPNVPPDQAQAYMQRLMATASITKDPQFQQDTTDYLKLVQDGQQQ